MFKAKSTPLPTPGRTALLLILIACQGKILPTGDRTSSHPALDQYPDVDRDLRSYADGRESEIRTLEQWLERTAPMREGTLDSIGATAADLQVDRYLRLVSGVDSALVRWGENGKLDRRLRRLDSLRVERRVLLVRLTIQDTGGDR